MSNLSPTLALWAFAWAFAWAAVMLGHWLKRHRDPEGYRLIQRMPYPLRPGGNWEGATKPELDKSTTGLLLANRVRRDPSLLKNVTITPHPAPGRPDPAQLDELWDHEIDG